MGKEKGDGRGVREDRELGRGRKEERGRGGRVGG